MAVRRRAILIIIPLVAVLSVSAFYFVLNSSRPREEGVGNLLVNGGFEDGVCFQPPAGVAVTNYQCTAGWYVFTNYGTVSAGTLADVTGQSVHSGSHALEFKIGKAAGNLGITAIQHLNQSECQVGSGNPFGLAFQKGLTFSFWYREINVSGVSFGATVVFHNGTSKLAMAYHLEPSTIVGYKVHGLNLSSSANEGSVDVYLNSSMSGWKESSHNLYQEFVRYFGIDPILNHYCVNYVSLGLGQEAGNSPNVNATESYAYGYFDDVALYVVA